ncbi:MAG: HEAT repeat domain-containing protein, partial [Cyanobacteria bacterium]|nr:HEAT repeat domain-containing protein [Cyanobacteriota bacterium]
MKFVDQGGFPHSSLSRQTHLQGGNLLSNSPGELDKLGYAAVEIANDQVKFQQDKFQGCSQQNGLLRDVSFPSNRNSGRPTLKFGILDPISLSVMGAAGLLAGGVGGIKLRKIFKNKATLNQQVKDLNTYLENLGAHHQVTAKNIFSVDTVEQILAHTNSEAKAEEVIPWLNLIQANLADDKQSLLTQVYLNRGIRHASPELRFNFVSTLTSEKTPRKLYQPLLIQFEKEENPQVAQALEKALFPMVAIEDVTELKASLAINSAPESFRHFCIKVMAQKKFFNSEMMALFLELLTKETNPNILKTVRETITDFSGQGDPESLTTLFKNNLKSNNLEVKRTAIAYLGGLKDPQLFPLLWESFLNDANGEIKPNISEEYFRALRITANESHFPLVLKGLDSPQEEVLKATFRLLKIYAKPETTPALLSRLDSFKELSKDLYPEMEGLLLVGLKPESKKQSDELLKWISHPSSRIRKTVIQAFDKFNDPQLLTPWFKQIEIETDATCIDAWKNKLKNISLDDIVVANQCTKVLKTAPAASEARKIVTEMYQAHKV